MRQYFQRVEIKRLLLVLINNLCSMKQNRFARNELYPLAAKMDDEEWWPENVF